jgi:hypothetical protein
MRLHNWVKCWAATCIFTAGCDVQTVTAPQPANAPQSVRRDDDVESKAVSIIAELNKIRPEKI